MEQSIQRLRKELSDRLAESGACTDEDVMRQIDLLLLKESRRTYCPVREMNRLQAELFCSVRKLDVLQELLDDPEVMEIMVNGYDRIFVERAGKIFRWEKAFTSRERLEDVIQQIVAGCNRVVNENMPIADARLADGSRIHVALPPVALDGPVLTIRRFPDDPIDMEDLIRMDSISREAADFLQKLVETGYSLMIGGGTSAGKTTFLNALSAYIPGDERVITIEDNAELQIHGIENLVRMEAKSANMKENREISIRDLIRASLRMRPDRIIVGEVRGAEAIDLLQALNTGHEGSLSTAHANSPEDMVSRLETMVLMGMQLPPEAVRRQIASGIDIFVQLGRDREKRRKVMKITEVTGCEENRVCMQTLFERNYQTGKLERSGELCRTAKLERAGLS
jgi:pilus assembly protein CpaF